MNEDALNASVRKFLKTVGVTSQREIEMAVRKDGKFLAMRATNISNIGCRNFLKVLRSGRACVLPGYPRCSPAPGRFGRKGCDRVLDPLHGRDGGPCGCVKSGWIGPDSCGSGLARADGQ